MSGCPWGKIAVGLAPASPTKGQKCLVISASLEKNRCIIKMIWTYPHWYNCNASLWGQALLFNMRFMRWREAFAMRDQEIKTVDIVRGLDLPLRGSPRTSLIFSAWMSFQERWTEDNISPSMARSNGFIANWRRLDARKIADWPKCFPQFC